MYESNASLDEDENICRVCMVKSAKRRKKNLLLSIFDPLEKKNGIQIYQALEDICHVQNLSTDSFTKKICPSCVDEVKNVYKSVNRLRDKCRESNEKFMAAFCRQKIEEVDIVIKEEEVIPDEIMPPIFDVVVKIERIDAPVEAIFVDDCKPTKPTPKKKVRKESKQGPKTSPMKMRIRGKSKPKRVKTDPNRKYCCKCTETFETNEELLGHFHFYHSETIQPDEEPDELDPKDNTNKIPCPLCKKMVTNLSKHTKRRHYTQHAPRICRCHCRICGQEYNNYTSRKICELRHENAGKNVVYDCKLCKRSFCSIFAYRHHRKHGHKEASSFACEICGEMMRTQKTLEFHLYAHTRVFICDVCKKPHRRKDQLQGHLLRHFQRRDFQCDVCPKAFILAEELKRHKAIHAKHMARAAASSTTQQPQPNEFQPMANNYQILQMPQI